MPSKRKTKPAQPIFGGEMQRERLCLAVERLAAAHELQAQTAAANLEMLRDMADTFMSSLLPPRPPARGKRC